MGVKFTGPITASSDPTGTALTAMPAVIAALTDSSGGTANETLEAVGDTSAGDESGAINNNFADLAAKQALIIAKLEAIATAFNIEV